MSYDLQQPDGIEKNKLYAEDTAVHDWYRFVLSYPPHLVRQYLQRFQVCPGQTVLDPFCGTGTTLVEAKKLGFASIGTEANPVVQFAAQTKLDWTLDPAALVSHAQTLATVAQARLTAHPGDWKSLDPDREKLLLTNSISPLPLHKALLLLETLDTAPDSVFRPIERLAFAKQLVSTASNLYFGPEVGVSRRKKEDVPLVEAWFAQISKMAADLATVADRSQVPAQVYLGDARSLPVAIAPASIAAVITSPPYPNEKDYTRTTRLESVLLGFLGSKQELRDHKQRLLRSNSRNIYKDDREGDLVAHCDRVMALADQIEQRRLELGKTSGFERAYHRVVRNYFGGMWRHFADLRPLLKSGASLAYVVGDQASFFRIPIRTGQILAELATDLGYEVVAIDLFRTRLATATQEQLREEVVVLRWPG